MKNRKGFHFHFNAVLSLVCIVGFFMITTVSCSFPTLALVDESEQITNIEERLSFSYLSHQSYMGGSVIYNPDKPSAGQLRDNVTVAVRIGYAQCDNSTDEKIYSDISSLSEYGRIIINTINKESVNFGTVFYNNNGEIIRQNNYELIIDNQIDINSDGLPDLEYKRSLRKRPGFENAIYLTFLSSQETLNTTMFAVLPEQYSRGVYPSGILGVNPNGKFIVNKYEVNTTNRAAVLGIMYGDYVMDSAQGTYQRVISSTTYRKARAIDEVDLEPIDEDSSSDFHFSFEEFYDIEEVKNLLSLLPDSILQQVSIYDDEIAKLNAVLEFKTLITEIATSKNLDLESPELIEIVDMILKSSQSELIEFNRNLIQVMYPEYCPIKQNAENDITSIFPLLSVIISSDEVDSTNSEQELQRSASCLTADSYSEYIKQKNEIDSVKKTFYPIGNFSYKFPGWDKLIKKETNNSTTPATTVPTDAKIPEENIKSFQEVNEILASSFLKTNLPTSITNGAGLQIGLMGHFKITWGNVEGGIYAGVYITADTNLDISKTLVEYPSNEIPKVSIFESQVSLLNIDLKLFDAPPITIGVVSFKFSLTGGIEIPCSISVKGNIVTSLYAGYTGFYAVGFKAWADYGVKTKTYKVWGVKITIPTGWKFDPGCSGDVIVKTAFFVGNVSDIQVPILPKLQSGSIELCVSPYVYIEPGVTVANCLYGGLQIGPAFDLGIGMKLKVNDKTYLPTGFDIYTIYGKGIDLKANYGIGVTIPIINKKIEYRNKVDIPFKFEKTRETKIIKSKDF